MQQLLAKNLSEELELKENIMKGAVRTVSKTSAPLSFPLSRNALDVAEQEGKRGKQREGPPLLWLFMPLGYQTEHTHRQPQGKPQSQHFVFLQHHQEGCTHWGRSGTSLQQQLPQTPSLSYKQQVRQLRYETRIKWLTHSKSFL